MTEEKQKELLSRYVAPPLKATRPVEVKDIDQVIAEAEIMFQLCGLPRDKYPNAFAIAHNQINDQDPLAFFVSVGGDIIINPKIIRHSNYTVDKPEGCMSYPENPMIKVTRWNKCEVEYQDITDDGQGLTDIIKKSLSGKEAQIFQHEIQHLEGKSLYDDTIKIQ